MTKLVSVTVLSILCVTCGKSETQTDKASEGKTPAKLDEQAKLKNKAASSPRPLPALDLAPVSAKKMKEARLQNSKALEKQKAKDYDGAIASYHAALAADPGHIKARYNLATALALAGKSGQAIAILKEFAGKKDCVPCAGQGRQGHGQ